MTLMVPLTDDIVGRETSGLEMSPTGAAGEAVHVVLLRAREVQPGWWLDLQARLVLPGVRVGGWTVILEPHGVWRGGHEAEVTRKYRLFREMFGNFFHLILVFQPEFTQVRDSFRRFMITSWKQQNGRPILHA